MYPPYTEPCRVLWVSPRCGYRNQRDTAIQRDVHTVTRAAVSERARHPASLTHLISSKRRSIKKNPSQIKANGEPPTYVSPQAGWD